MNPYKKMYVMCEDEYITLRDKDSVVDTETCVNDSLHKDVEIPTAIQVTEKPAVIQETEKPVKVKSRYSCNQCEKDYGDKHDLRRHIKKVHVAQVKQELKKLELSKQVKKRNKAPPQAHFVHKIKKWRTLG